MKIKAISSLFIIGVAVLLVTSGCNPDITDTPVYENPVVAILNPANDGDNISGDVVVEAMALGDESPVTVVFSVYLFDADADFGFDRQQPLYVSEPIEGPPYSETIDTSEASYGMYVIVAYATDGRAKRGFDMRFVNLLGDTDPPQVDITSPADGATLSGNVTVTVQATDPAGVDSVAIAIFDMENNLIEGDYDTTEPYSYNWDSNVVENGQYQICAGAVDGLGNWSDWICISVSVQNVVPPQSQTLKYDDGIAEIAYGFDEGPGEMLTVFQSPFTQTAKVDTVWFYMSDNTAGGERMSVTVRGVDGSRHPTNIMGKSASTVYNGNVGWWYWVPQNEILIAGEYLFGCGFQQEGSINIGLGHDSSGGFTNNTFYFSDSLIEPFWENYETYGLSDIPMIRVTISTPAGDRLTVSAVDGFRRPNGEILYLGGPRSDKNILSRNLLGGD